MTSQRGPGRPIDDDLTDAIMDAAVASLIEDGATQLTVRGVVARSGTSSATIYRRWPTKTSLLLATTRHLMSLAIPERPYVSLASDIDHIARNLVHLLTETAVGTALPHLLQASYGSADIRHEVQRWFAERRAVVQRVLVRAIARREARADLPVEHGAELFSAPIYYRFLVSQDPLDESFVAGHVREYLHWAAPAPCP